MKLQLSTAAIFIGMFSLYAQTPCENGMAGIYPCNGYDLQSHISLAEMNASAGSGSWGWTDPQDGKEYAILGLDNGTAFVDISDPINPVYLGKLPAQTQSSPWREMKIYDNHVFVVSEASNHGMQVFDLTRLRNVANPPAVFTTDAHYGGFGNGHNIVINEETGYAYIVGTSHYDGGLYIINIQDPVNPVFVTGYGIYGYTHDAQVVNYIGPDSEHHGKEIFVGSNTYQIIILDVTDKNNIQLISALDYSDVGYTHQGWFTEDQRYFILGDELDEVYFGFNTRTLVFDFTDLDNPQHHFDYYSPTPAIDHNGYVVGNKFYLANYTSGIRVFDISDIADGVMTETGFFDSYPENNNASFNGVWNVYPFFESGNIALCDIDGGFFLVKDPNFMAVPETDQGVFSMYPNPAENQITIRSKTEKINSVKIINTLGQVLSENNNIDAFSESVNTAFLPKGVYLININGTTIKKLIKK